MNDKLMVLLQWIPRILTLLLAGFLSLFALDGFQEGYGFFKTIISLFIHLIPVWVILIVLWISWNRPMIGAIFYPCLGIAYAITAWDRPDWIAAITGPLVLIGVGYAVQFWVMYKKASTER